MRFDKSTVLILLLSACSGGNGGSSLAGIQWLEGIKTEKLDGYLADFEEDFATKVNFEVVIVDRFSDGQASSSRAGTCYRSGSFRRVEILQSAADHGYLRYALYHELGHCQLNLAHYEKTSDIMNAVANFDVIADFDFYIGQMAENYHSHVYKKGAVSGG